MWVKICANTNLADTLRAAELGADAVGFVFAASKRRVTAEEVGEITPHLPAHVERVGVFDWHDAGEIEDAARGAGLNAVQLHSALNFDLLDQLSERLGPEIDLIQTLHWRVDEAAGGSASAEEFAAAIAGLRSFRPHPIRVLVDSKIGGASGGTGIAFDWAAAAQAFAAAQAEGIRLIVAGGLTPANVGEAVQRLRPWGVDVASGVEAEPGRKDPARLASFVKRAHGG